MASPRLWVEVESALLLPTPVGALLLNAVVLEESPSALQMLGCVLVLTNPYVTAAKVSDEHEEPSKRAAPRTLSGSD